MNKPKVNIIHISANESLKLINRISEQLDIVKVNEPILVGTTESGEQFEIRINPSSFDQLPWSLKKTNIKLKNRSVKKNNSKK
ncbi:MAG: hypothetical protein ACOC2U_03315 [bacterium]